MRKTRWRRWCWRRQWRQRTTRHRRSLPGPARTSTPTNLYDGATDGLLIARYLAGFSGGALTGDALSNDATITDPAAVKTRLDNIRPALDVDGDGQYRVGTDGLLILRYLLGLRGNALIAGALGSNPVRSTAPDIEAFIQLLMP